MYNIQKMFNSSKMDKYENELGKFVNLLQSFKLSFQRLRRQPKSLLSMCFYKNLFFSKLLSSFEVGQSLLGVLPIYYSSYTIFWASLAPKCKELTSQRLSKYLVSIPPYWISLKLIWIIFSTFDNVID